MSRTTTGHLVIPGQEAQVVYFTAYGAALWTDWIAERWEMARTTLAQVVEFGHTQGLHVLFVFVPIKFRVY
jgi:hypothetical protein